MNMKLTLLWVQVQGTPEQQAQVSTEQVAPLMELLWPLLDGERKYVLYNSKKEHLKEEKQKKSWS